MSATDGDAELAPRQWARTPQTRAHILSAARDVFAEHGFANAGVAEIVERADSSVGSVYHHFGGKTELFTALWQEFQRALEQRSTEAVAAARANGVGEPLELFSVGARAFFAAVWELRETARIFYMDDTPPEFERMRRERGKEWFRQNTILLRLGDSPAERMLVSAVLAIISATTREIIDSASHGEADALAETALALLNHLDPRTILGAGGDAQTDANP